MRAGRGRVEQGVVEWGRMGTIVVWYEGGNQGTNYGGHWEDTLSDQSSSSGKWPPATGIPANWHAAGVGAGSCYILWCLKFYVWCRYLPNGKFIGVPRGLHSGLPRSAANVRWSSVPGMLLCCQKSIIMPDWIDPQTFYSCMLGVMISGSVLHGNWSWT